MGSWQSAVDSGQLTVGSGQWTVDNGQRKVDSFLLFVFCCLFTDYTSVGRNTVSASFALGNEKLLRNWVSEGASAIAKYSFQLLGTRGKIKYQLKWDNRDLPFW